MFSDIAKLSALKQSFTECKLYVCSQNCELVSFYYGITPASARIFVFLHERCNIREEIIGLCEQITSIMFYAVINDIICQGLYGNNLISCYIVKTDSFVLQWTLTTL
jgi:hypothetical protein